ncbi:MAG: hypothetical protein JW820_07920 [Spirochaetales bacterium]|nr:hypothetical protein [Spirochaetales bacterium]
MHYVRCKTCGRYIDPSLAFRKLYCSEECAASFLRCANCGGYFPAGAGYDDKTCSQACAVRYALNRSRGTMQAGREGEEST